MELIVVKGDITLQHVDAVLNAANEAMRGGGGVDGAIHHAAGHALLDECRQKFPAGLPTGQAGWTKGYDLPATWVIHVVGPVYDGTGRNRDKLVSCYANALRVADSLGVRTLALPIVSSGAYRWPFDDAVAACVDTLRATPTRVAEARIVAFGPGAFDTIAAHVAHR